MESIDSNNKSYFKKIGLSFAISILVVLIIYSILNSIFKVISPVYDNYVFSTLIKIAVLYLIGYPLVYFLLKKLTVYKGNELQEYDEHKANLGFKAIMGLLSVCVFLLYTTDILNSYPAESTIDVIISKKFTSNTLLSVFLIYFYALIVSPIADELLFRKFLMNRVRKFGDSFAILFTAIVYSIFQFDASRILFSFAIGIVFAAVVTKTNNIRHSIFLHVFVNAAGLLLVPTVLYTISILKLDDSFTLDLVTANIFYPLYFAFIAVLGLIGIIYIICLIPSFIAGAVIAFKKVFEYFRNRDQRLHKLDTSGAYMNLGFILFIIIGLLQFFISNLNIVELWTKLP